MTITYPVTTNFQRTATWLARCGKTPSPEGLSVQIGCDLEETAEFLREVTIVTSTGLANSSLQEIATLLEGIGTILKRGDAQALIHDRERALDALCDREVTGNGVAYMADMRKDGADKAVLDANDDKLVDGKPVILPGGKIGKRPGWTAPDLTPFI